MVFFWVNPSGGEIFRIPPDRPWGTPSLPCNGYRVSLMGDLRKEWRPFLGLRDLFLGEI